MLCSPLPPPLVYSHTPTLSCSVFSCLVLSLLSCLLCSVLFCALCVMVFPSVRPSSSSVFGKYLCFLSLFLLFHCVISATQFRHFVRSSGNTEIPTPIDIYIECAVSMILCVCGCSLWIGSFKSLLSAPTFHSKTLDNSIHYREDFIRFNHRGKLLQQFKQKYQ